MKGDAVRNSETHLLPRLNAALNAEAGARLCSRLAEAEGAPASASCRPSSFPQLCSLSAAAECEAPIVQKIRALPQVLPERVPCRAVSGRPTSIETPDAGGPLSETHELKWRRR